MSYQFNSLVAAYRSIEVLFGFGIFKFYNLVTNSILCLFICASTQPVFLERPLMSFKPVRLSQMVPVLTRKVFRERGFHQASVLTNWSEIVGQELAAKCCPEKISREGVLTLRVDGPVALEIQHLEPQLLERIATHFGYRAVVRISIRQGPLSNRHLP